ncbi:hypothetical protein B296_00056730 [Ensete ventricosum]|uniref:Uncharacterized protein n=1 Tax=Ensete ventricosum TaxID=4639 RepID=A0A426X116_ENSVE|nr:hypothetical protein B296_00056730 [Ensete ventricosum]
MPMIIIVRTMPRTTSMMVILLHTLWECHQIHTTRYRSMSTEGCLAIFLSTHRALICYLLLHYRMCQICSA